MKILSKVLIPCILLQIFLISAFASNCNIKVVVDGNSLTTTPAAVDGRTLIPVRDLSEALKAKVYWDNATKRVTITKLLYRVDRSTNMERIETRKICLWVGSKEATVDGNVISLDVAPQIINGRTMLPVRAVCEWLEATVDWNNNTSTVIVTRGPYESFGDARAYNAQIDLAERDAINNALNKDQEALDKAIKELYSWISEGKLRDKSVAFLYGETATIFKSKVGFYEYGSLTGSIGELIYEMPDYNNSLEDGMTETYNGVRIKNDKGILYFKVEDLQKLRILE